MKVKRESEVAQSCPTLSMDCSLPGSSVHGIFQARVLEWGAIAFSEKYIYIYIYMYVYTEFDFSQGDDVKIEQSFLIIETDVQFFDGNGHICYLKYLN